MNTDRDSQSVRPTQTHLPVSHRNRGASSAVSRILVGRWSEISAIELSEQVKQNIVLLSWALLLYRYTLNDSVAFEVYGEQLKHEGLVDTTCNCHAGRIAICDIKPRTYRESTTLEELEVSVRVHPPCQLSSLENLCNAGVSYTLTEQTMPHNLDFLVIADCQDGSDDICLITRCDAVPVKFTAMLGANLHQLLGRAARTKVFQLNPSILSRHEHIQIQEFVQKPLSVYQDCMHHLVKKSAMANPAAQAIQAWDGVLSYVELEAYSDQIARVLVAKGVKIGEYVPFVFEKSMWSVVAVLAILKAGAAFVPLDPTQPLERIRGILADVDAQIVLVSASLEMGFKHMVNKTVVVSMATAKPTPSNKEDSGQSLPVVTPDHTAFVLFTSGSTGRPKGMIMQHGAYSTHTICHGRAMGYMNARVLQFAAHTFDVYVMDVFTTLTFGGCVCIPSEDERRFNIAGVFNDFQIDLAILTPSFAHVLDPALVPNLKVLAVGGEALKRETVQRWIKGAKQTSLIQIYGPAEVGICVLGQLSESDTSPETIGYPLDNSLCLVIDPSDASKLVPLGAIGELVVAGPTMLSKYLNNPEKTKACFIDNPPWATMLNLPHQRFYRSGDLVRYNIERMDGSFDFVGRRDSQIKYHGQRMELEEIEHHLSTIEGVSACVVTLPKAGPLEGKLVAILQLESSDQARVISGRSIQLLPEADLSLGKMREHLAKRLPAYMIPNALLVVQHIPFTASLKLDRPAVNRWISQLEEELIADELLQKLSCDVLAANESIAQALSMEYARLVGGNDRRHREVFEGHNFSLQSGGIDSIQIISLSNFVQRTWQVKIPMALILSSSATIRRIAAIIERGEVHQPPKASREHSNIELEASSLTEKLATDIASHTIRNHFAVRNVLLTGATGFLGIELLRQLLTQGLRVFALVRGRNQISARQKLVNQARAVGWWNESFNPQLEVWLGNLSKSDLDLDDSCRGKILGKSSSDTIHAIVHNGARVHYGLDYSSLRNTNVLSTLELLRLAATSTSKVQSFVYISGGQQLTFDEDDGVVDVPVELGYIRSKLVSELVVKKCMQRPEFDGAGLRIVKPGYIIGPSSNGVSNLTDFLWRLVRSCVEIGGYNVDDADRWICVADKGKVSQVVLSSALDNNAHPITKVLDGLRLFELWNILTCEFFFPLKGLPQKEWLHKIQTAVADQGDTHVMFPLLHMLEEGEPIGTVAGPAEASPGVKDAIRANIRYLIEVGYLSSSANYLANGSLTPDKTPDGTEDGEFDV